MTQDQDAGPAIDAVQIEGIAEVMGRAGRDRLLTLLIEHVPIGHAAIRAAAVRGDGEALGREAHSLRGAVAGVGAKPLAAVLARIEAGWADAATLDALDRAVARVLAAAREMLEA